MPEFMITFLIYGFIGFLCEEIYCSIGEKKFVWRGFLYGPFIPVYGFGGLGIVLLLTRFSTSPIVIFLLSFVLTSLIEYIASYIMEKTFNMKWWDYTNYKFNIHGRVCLLNSTMFGVGGLFLMYVIEPFLAINIYSLSSEYTFIIGSIIYTLIFLDTGASVFSIIKAKDYINKYSYLLRNKVDELKANPPKPSYFLNRFQRAFPNLESVKNKYNVKAFRAKLNEIRVEYQKLKVEAKNKLIR